MCTYRNGKRPVASLLPYKVVGKSGQTAVSTDVADISVYWHHGFRLSTMRCLCSLSEEYAEVHRSILPVFLEVRIVLEAVVFAMFEHKHPVRL